MSRLDRFENILKSYDGRKLASDNSFGIEEFPDFYRVHGVQYRGDVVSYDFAKDTLPEATQARYAKHALNAKDDEFRAASAPLVYAICKALYKNRECLTELLIKKAKENLELLISSVSYSATLSKVMCDTTGQGKIIHDYKQATQYSKPAKIVGETGFITDLNMSAEGYVHALLDTNDSMQEITEVFKWATDNEAYIYCIDHNPSEKLEYEVILHASGERFCFDGSRSGGIWPALGVRYAGKQVKQ